MAGYALNDLRGAALPPGSAPMSTCVCVVLFAFVQWCAAGPLHTSMSFSHKFVFSTQIRLFHTRSPQLMVYSTLACPVLAGLYALLPPWWSSFVLPCSGKLHVLLFSFMHVDAMPFLLCPWPLTACPLPVTIALWLVPRCPLPVTLALCLSPLAFACLPVAFLCLLYLMAFLPCLA